MEDKLKKIKGIAFDIDGVMTDGSILVASDGDILRTYDAKDSFAVRMANMRGYHTAVITGGRSESIRHRFVECGVPYDDVYLASRDKIRDFKTFCERHGMQPDEVMYFGDDLPDIPVLRACGIGVAPADAVDEVKEAADYISDYGGGKLCIRHAIEMVMRAQGRWVFEVEQYERLY